MGYLERNAEIGAQINQQIISGRFVLSRSSRILTNSSDTTTFTPVGAVTINNGSQRLHLGIKEYTNKLVNNRLVNDLATIAAIADGLPTIGHEVPIFLGLLEKTNGQAIGILTEDFQWMELKVFIQYM